MAKIRISEFSARNNFCPDVRELLPEIEVLDAVARHLAERRPVESPPGGDI